MAAAVVVSEVPAAVAAVSAPAVSPVEQPAPAISASKAAELEKADEASSSGSEVSTASCRKNKKTQTQTDRHCIVTLCNREMQVKRVKVSHAL